MMNREEYEKVEERLREIGFLPHREKNNILADPYMPDFVWEGQDGIRGDSVDDRRYRKWEYIDEYNRKTSININWMCADLTLSHSNRDNIVEFEYDTYENLMEYLTIGNLNRVLSNLK